MHDENTTVNKFSTWTAAAAAFIAAAVTLTCFFFLGLRNLPYVKLDNQLPGQTAVPLSAGEQSTVSFTLQNADKTDNAVLCFMQKNAILRVRIDGSDRGTFGEEGSSPETGLVMVTVPLKNKDWGKKVEIEIEARGGETPQIPSKLLLLRAEDAAKYPLIGHETKFTVLLLLMVAGLFLLLGGLLSLIRIRQSGERILLGAAMLAMGAAAFGECGFFCLLTGNTVINTLAGSYAALLAPALLALFLSVSTAPHKIIRKRIYLVLTLLAAAGFIFLLVMRIAAGHAPGEYQLFVDLAAAGLLLFAVLMERASLIQSSREDPEDLLVRIGLRVALVCALITLLLNQGWRIPVLQGFVGSLPRMDCPSVGVAVLSLFLLLFEWKKAARILRKEENRELLRRLSYTDILTDIPNRHYCDRKIAEISKHIGYQATPVEYTIFMMDVDYLANVNDTHGFEVGDEMIRCVAEALSDAMRGCGLDVRPERWPVFREEDDASGNRKKDIRDMENGDCFFGRWGGDEFVACTFRSQADAFTTSLTSRIAAINIEKRVPFQVSVSIGSSDFQSGSYDRITRALMLADRAMLERKAQYHEAHEMQKQKTPSSH